MKTLRKIGIVTLASSLALASVLASTVAEQIAEFGYYGKFALWTLVVVEGVKLVSSFSTSKKVTSAVGGKIGDAFKKAAKKWGATAVRAEGEAAAEYKWLADLRAKVDGATGTKDIADIKSALQKEEREVRTFDRRVERLINDTNEFKKNLSDPSISSQIDKILNGIDVLNKSLFVEMGREGKFEHCLDGTTYTPKGKGATAIDYGALVKTSRTVKKGTTLVFDWAKHKPELLKILDAAIAADRGIVTEIKNLEALTAKAVKIF